MTRKKRKRLPSYDRLNFTVSGVPESTPRPGGTLLGLRRALEIGCDGMEIEWVYQVAVKDKDADLIREVREETRCALTAHAPYYVNLNSPDDRKLEASINRLLKTARKGARCGCTSFTFHAAFLMGGDRRTVHRRVIGVLRDIRHVIEAEKLDIMMRPELTGKESSWGSLEELLEASAEFPGVEPCIDWAHLHARTGGGFNTRDEFRAVLREYASVLGDESLKDMHMHVTGIAYGRSGEKHHLALRDSDMNYKDLLRTFKEFDVRGVLVAETPVLERDTLLLKRAWRQVRP
jgi:deoxyribonuclease-4